MGLLAVIFVAALILVNAVYVAAEFAAVSVRRSRLRQLAGDGNVLARWLLPYVDNPAALDRYIAACQIGITLSSLVLGAYAQATFAVWLAPWIAAAGGLETLAAQSTAAVAVLLVLTAAQVILGELVPKSLALQYPTPAAVYTFPVMLASLWIYRPFLAWLNGSGLFLLRLIGAPMQTHRHIHSPDEIELLIAESRDGGLLEHDEHERLHRALKLNLRQAKQLMVPRRRMTALDIETPLNEVVAIVASSPYSRLPVYRESLDNVVGVLHTRDLVQWFVDGSKQATLAPTSLSGGSGSRAVIRRRGTISCVACRRFSLRARCSRACSSGSSSPPSLLSAISNSSSSGEWICRCVCVGAPMIRSRNRPLPFSQAMKGRYTHSDASIGGNV